MWQPGISTRKETMVVRRILPPKAMMLTSSFCAMPTEILPDGLTRARRAVAMKAVLAGVNWRNDKAIGTYYLADKGRCLQLHRP